MIKPFLRRRVLLAAAVLLIWNVTAPVATGQSTSSNHTRNVQLLGSAPLDLFGKPARSTYVLPEVVLDQDPNRALAYVSTGAGVTVVDIADPARPRVLSHVAIDNREETGDVIQDLAVAAVGARRLVLAGVAAAPSSSAQTALLVFDVTGSPDTPPSLIQKIPASGATGFRRVFAYKHSTGRSLALGVGGGDAFVYDIERVAAGDAKPVAQIDTPSRVDMRTSGFDGVYAAFEPASQQDRIYLAGAGGYYVYDFTDTAEPILQTRVNAAAVQRGKHVVASPDARLLVTSAGYRLSPLYIFDLAMASGVDVKTVRTASGAWTADWRHYAQNFEVRWPFIFVAALFDGLQVVNMRDETNPYTVGFHHTWTGDRPPLSARSQDLQGSWSIDVRNHDGLIAVGDTKRGLLLFVVEGFQGWDGRGWGLPNASSVQDWEGGPDGSSFRLLQRTEMSGG